MSGSRLAVGLAGLVILLCLVGVVAGVAGGAAGAALPFVALALAISAYGAVGALIASQVPRNPVGWLIVAAALAVALFLWAGGLLAGFLVPIESGAAATDWHRLLGWIIVLLPLPAAPACLILALLYFPDGRLATRWFRPVVWVVAGGSLLRLLQFLAFPRELGMPQLGLQGPEWAQALPGVATYGGIWGISIAIGSLAILTSLVIRRRKASEEDRRPLRLLLRMLVALIGGSALAFALLLTLQALSGRDNEATWLLLFFPFLAGGAIVLFGIPVALTVGVLRYRVYQVDLTIRKTIVASVMVAFVLMAILLIVAVPVAMTSRFDLTGSLSSWVVVPAFLVGICLGPVRRWARRGADRILYGERATPYEVLSEFSEKVGETYSSEDVLPRMAQLLAVGTGATEARVWLRVGAELRDVARWPAESAPAPASVMAGDAMPPLPDGEIFPVVHQGDTLGALAITVLGSDPMNPAKERLAHDLASQAGLVLRNVRLVEELQDSRRRIVAAQDERARALERNIHDGAQQQLVALAVKLGLAERLVERDPANAAAMLAEAKAATGEALEDLRDLARGIYPPLLADEGLASALRAQARKSTVPVTVVSDGIDRYPRDIESAVYFCCLEAMQNVAKHAASARASVRLMTTNGHLTFEIADDGPGFDLDGTSGTGLQGMADRLDAIDGELEVRSAPGTGTTVAGRVPIAEARR